MEPEVDRLSLSAQLQAWEKGLAALLLAALFLANLALASRSPWGGWMDEMFMTDPGLNLASGKGWTSSAWRYQTDREFWAQNSPLYPAGLSLWARAFGTSMVASRAYCYVLGTVGMFLFWLGNYRLRLLTPGYRLFWIVFLGTAFATNFMMRNARYDVWIFVGLGLAWVGASLQRPAARYGLIFLGCYLGPWAGFISLTYLFLLAGLAVVASGFRLLREAAAAVAGALAGMVSVLGFYGLIGVLPDFWRMVGRLSVAGSSLQPAQVLQVFTYPRWDPGIGLMLLVLPALTVLGLQRRHAGCRPWLTLGWGVVIGMPFIMLARGIFATMYFYMLVVPLSLAILVLLTQLPRGWVQRGIVAVMALICFTGLPSRAYVSLREWDYRDPRHIREFVRTHVRPEDAVYTDYLFYFELRDYARWYGGPMYCEVIPPDEAARVNVAIVNDAECGDLARDASPLLRIGGGWTKVAVFPTAEMRAGLKSTPRLTTTYTLYRRQPAAASEAPVH